MYSLFRPLSKSSESVVSVAQRGAEHFTLFDLSAFPSGRSSLNGAMLLFPPLWCYRRSFAARHTWSSLHLSAHTSSLPHPLHVCFSGQVTLNTGDQPHQWKCWRMQPSCMRLNLCANKRTQCLKWSLGNPKKVCAFTKQHSVMKIFMTAQFYQHIKKPKSDK